MSSHGENDRKNIRFSDTEKRVLHFLFKEYEDIIDIKQRRNNKNYKMSEVRECWQTILNKFNLHHGTTDRNLKQIQKFWLNSRLRMRNSSIDSTGGNSFKMKGRKKKSTCEKDSHIQYNDSQHQIYSTKSKVEHSDSPNSNNSQSDEDDDDEDSYENERENNKQRTLKQELLDSKYEDNNEDEDIDDIDETNNEAALRQQDNGLHHSRTRKPHQNIRSNESECSDQSASYNPQNISNDNIEELQTFQNTNPPNTVASGYLINTLNQSNPILREQQLSQRPNEISDDQQTHLTHHTQHILNQQQYETQINLLKIQEYENKIKEQQLKCDQQKIEILKSQEELEHFKEMNRLKIREMQLKIFLLEEQTKIRRNNKM